jgi:hypothetical protein
MHAERHEEFDILLTVYHYVSQLRNQLNTLSLSQSLYCVLNPRHVSGFKCPSSGGTTLAVLVYVACSCR